MGTVLRLYYRGGAGPGVGYDVRAHSNTIRNLVASTPHGLEAAPPAPPPRPKRRRSPLGHAEAVPPAEPATASVGRSKAHAEWSGAMSHGYDKVSDIRGLHKDPALAS